MTALPDTPGGPRSARPSLPRLRRGTPSRTGVPRLDAASDFWSARRAQLVCRIMRALGFRRLEPRWARSLDPVFPCSPLPARLRMLPVAAIVGTMEPTHDFDARFRPCTNHVEERWRRVAQAYREGRSLPPIRVIEQPDGYYVIDGRHRVSVSRALRVTHIEAWVVPLAGSHSG